MNGREEQKREKERGIWSRRDFFTRLGWGGFGVFSLFSLLGFIRSAFPRVLFQPPTKFKGGAQRACEGTGGLGPDPAGTEMSNAFMKRLKASQSKINLVAGAIFYPLLFDPQGKVADKYEFRGHPVTFLVDREGFLVGKVLGERIWSGPEAKALATDHLRKSP